MYLLQPIGNGIHSLNGIIIYYSFSTPVSSFSLKKNAPNVICILIFSLVNILKKSFFNFSCMFFTRKKKEY